MFNQAVFELSAYSKMVSFLIRRCAPAAVLRRTAIFRYPNVFAPCPTDRPKAWNWGISLLEPQKCSDYFFLGIKASLGGSTKQTPSDTTHTADIRRISKRSKEIPRMELNGFKWRFSDIRVGTAAGPPKWCRPFCPGKTSIDFILKIAIPGYEFILKWLYRYWFSLLKSVWRQ